MKPTVREELKKCYLFTDFTEDEISAIEVLGEERTYHKGSAVFHENEVPNALFMIHYGTVRVEAWGPEGGEQQFDIAGNGSVLGEWAFVSHYPRASHAITLENTETIRFDFASLRKHFEAHPTTALKFYRSLSGRLSDVIHSCVLEIIRLREENQHLKHPHHL